MTRPDWLTIVGSVFAILVGYMSFATYFRWLPGTVTATVTVVSVAVFAILYRLWRRGWSPKL